MQINDIKALVARLGAIVEGWDEKSGAPAVERHIAASLLAELYEAVKFDTALTATPIAKVEEPVPIMTEEVAEPEEESAPEVIDLSDIFGSSFDVPEEVAEPAEEPIEEKVEEGPIEESVPAIEEEILVVEEESAVEEEPAPEEPIAEVEVEQTEEVEPTDEQPIEEVAEVEQPAEETVELPTATEEQPAEEIAEQPTEDTVENIVAEEQPTATEEEQPTEEVEEQPAAEEEQPATTDEEKPAEEEKPKSEQASLFDMDIVRRPRSSSGRRVIMSLYGESPATSRREKKAKSAEPTPTPEQKNEQKPEQKTEQEPIPAQPESVVEQAPAPAPEVTETPIAVSVAERIAAAQADGSQVLGDVIGAGTTTLAEAVAASQPTVQTVQNDRVNSLRNSIGINDRFIMIRDLFGGDGAAFDRAMEELDAFEDFNECLVYMSEYRWNPNSDGARMLMDLVTRKLL